MLKNIGLTIIKSIGLCLFLILMFCFFMFGTANAKTAIVGFTVINGGDTGALDAIECEDIIGDDSNRAIATGDIAMGLTSSKNFRVYRYNSSGTDSETTVLDIVVPDDRTTDCSGQGQWELMASWSLAPSSNPKQIFRDDDCTDQDDNVYFDVNCTTTTSGAEDCDIILYAQINGVAVELLHVDASNDAIEIANSSTKAIITLNSTADDMTDDTYNGIVIDGSNCGENISQWNLAEVSFDQANFWGKADADAAGKFPASGIAVAACTSGNNAVILVQGIVRNEGWTGLTIGGPVYLGDDSNITQNVPSTTGDCQQVIGYAISDSEIYFNFTPFYELAP